MRAFGWRLLISRADVWRTEGFGWAADNGAWSDFMAQRSFNDPEFDRFLEWIDKQQTPPDWLVLPDIVAGGMESLALSLRYMNRCLAAAPMVLIAVQDGMEADDIAPYVGPSVGVFLGGSTEWKLTKMAYWGEFCAARAIYYHVARINTVKRIHRAIAAGASSGDGSSGSRFAKNIARIDSARRQIDWLSPRSAV